MRIIEKIKEFVDALSDNEYYVITFRYSVKKDYQKHFYELTKRHFRNIQKESILCRLVETNVYFDKIIYDTTFFEILPLTLKKIEFELLNFTNSEIELLNKPQIYERLLPLIKSKETNSFKIIMDHN